jgi:peptidoglycan/LPS O-acetylase OafA/YrhL
MQPINFSSLPLAATLYFAYANIFIVFSHLTAIIMQDHNGLFAMANLRGDPFVGKTFTWDYLYIGPAWSLSVELLFYFFAPLIVRLRNGYLWRVALASAISLSTWAAMVALGISFVPWAYNFFLPNLIFFMLGSLSYSIFYSGVFTKFVPYNRITASLMAIVVLGTCILYSYIPTQLSLGIGRIAITNVFFLGSLVFICMPYIFELTKTNRVDQYIGNLSYLYHLVMVPAEKFLRISPHSAKGAKIRTAPA